jgi:hypothetical protein
VAERSYSDEEVREILRRAVDRDVKDVDALTHEELVDAAREIGIPAETVERAAAEIDEVRELRHEIELRRARRKRRFLRHTATWAVVNAFLFLIDFVAPGGWWFYWPLIGWGLFLALHMLRVVLPNHEGDERAARKVVERRRKRREKELAAQRRRERRRPGDAFEAAVEEGVALLLAAAARHMADARGRMEERPRPPPDTELNRYISRQKGGPAERPAPGRVRARVGADEDAREEELEAERERESRRRRR